MENLVKIFNAFNHHYYAVKDIKYFGNGHIHQTFMVTLENSLTKYILQQINHKVFPKVDLLQQNIASVLSHLETKQNFDKNNFPKMYSTKQDSSYYLDEKGDYWRLFKYISNSRTFSKPCDYSLNYQGGKCLGKFLTYLLDFNKNKLHTILPNFHNIDVRLQNFFSAISDNPVSRAELIQEEHQFVVDRIKNIKGIYHLGNRGDIRQMVIHGDPKIDNVLFDNSNRAICMIDLDTVMIGYIHYDFGDAIRTWSNSASEDESQIENISLDLTLFEAFTCGFLENASNSLSETEAAFLAESARLMSFLIGLRFLTDYIEGDTYFNIKSTHHNYIRAKNQFRLVKDIEEKLPRMQKIIDTHYRQNSL